MLERIEVILSDKKKYQSPWKDDNKSDSEYNLNRVFKSNGGGNFNFNFDFSVTKAVILLVSIVALLWLSSGFYIIKEGELAAVTRFGKYVRTATPGANYHLPFPIENIIKVKVDHIQKEEIGFRSSGDSNGNISKVLPEESLMLTGDENIADVNFFVQWRVDNIEDYLYNVDNIQTTVKSAAESAMREVIGSITIAQAQTDGRASVEDNAKKLLQKILNEKFLI